MAAPRKRRSVRSWHRWLGFLAALPLLVISLTGLLLNHTADLGLDERRTDAGLVLRRYGMALDGDPRTFAAGDHHVSQWENQLFLDGRALDAAGTGVLVGAVAVDGLTAVALDPSRILLYDETGLLVEAIGEATLSFGTIARVGRAPDSRLVIEDSEGRLHRFSADFLTYERQDTRVDETATDVAWSLPENATSPELRERMAAAYRGDGVPWSRVLLDLHTGKLFGLPGRYLVDLVTVAVIALAFTGLRLGLVSRK